MTISGRRKLQMMKTAIAALTSLCLLTTCSYAMDVETFLEMEKKGEPSRSSAMQYFSGAKEGVYYLNAALKEHYFCLPPNLELSNEEARNIALQMASKAISGGTGNPDIVAALILGLKEKFPCEGK